MSNIYKILMLRWIHNRILLYHLICVLIQLKAVHLTRGPPFLQLQLGLNQQISMFFWMESIKPQRLTTQMLQQIYNLFVMLVTVEHYNITFYKFLTI